MSDLTPRILESSDTTVYDRDTGAVRVIRRTVYRLGELGPFTADLPVSDFTEFALRAEMERTATALRPFA